MKYQLIIEVEDKPNCYTCNFYKGSDGDGDKSCDIVGYAQSISDLLDKCKFKPKRELKPKQLEWKEMYKEHTSTICSIYYKIKDCWDKSILIEFCNNEIQHSIPQNAIDRIEQAKCICEEHYINLFNAMIGE